MPAEQSAAPRGCFVHAIVAVAVNVPIRSEVSRAAISSALDSGFRRNDEMRGWFLHAIVAVAVNVPIRSEVSRAAISSALDSGFRRN
ncbi:MAG: hypothetical protein JXO72_15340, partial [Vicinamibacteria bacterium]|nr:hypothetical protein [Vicinamibacteria bacterium]